MKKANFILFLSFLFVNVVCAEEMPATTIEPDSATQAVTNTTNEQEILTEQSGFSRGSVMRSIFTNGIENREPIDNMQVAGNLANTITYFTELRDMSGQTAKHRWEYKGEVVAEVEFNVRGPRWRVWSSKTLMPQWEGEWKVSVLNAAGEVISEEVINYKNIDEMPIEAETSSSNGTDMTETMSSPEQPANAQ